MGTLLPLHHLSYGASFDLTYSTELNLVGPNTKARTQSTLATKAMHDLAARALRRGTVDVPLRLDNEFERKNTVGKFEGNSLPKYANWLLMSRDGIPAPTYPISRVLMLTGTVDMTQKDFCITTPIFKGSPTSTINGGPIHRFCKELSKEDKFVSVDEESRFQVHVGLGGRPIPANTIRKLASVLWLTEGLLYQICHPSHRPGATTPEERTPLLSLRRNSPLAAGGDKEVLDSLTARSALVHQQGLGYLPPDMLAQARTNPTVARVLLIWGMEDHELLSSLYSTNTTSGSLLLGHSVHYRPENYEVNPHKSFAIEPCCPGWRPVFKSGRKPRTPPNPQTIAFRCMAGTVDPKLAMKWISLCFKLVETCSMDKPQMRDDPFPALMSKVLQGICREKEYGPLDFLADLDMGSDVAYWRTKMALYPNIYLPYNMNSQSKEVGGIAAAAVQATSTKPAGSSHLEIADTDMADADAPLTSGPANTGNGKERSKPRGCKAKGQPAARKSLIMTVPIPSGITAKVAEIFGANTLAASAPMSNSAKGDENLTAGPKGKGVIRPQRASKAKPKPAASHSSVGTFPVPSQAAADLYNHETLAPSVTTTSAVSNSGSGIGQAKRGTKRKLQPASNSGNAEGNLTRGPKAKRLRKVKLQQTLTESTGGTLPIPSETAAVISDTVVPSASATSSVSTTNSSTGDQSLAGGRKRKRQPTSSNGDENRTGDRNSKRQRKAENQPALAQSTVGSLPIIYEATADTSSAVPPAMSAVSDSENGTEQLKGARKSQRKVPQKSTVGTLPTIPEATAVIFDAEADAPEPSAPSGSSQPSEIERTREPAPEKTESLIVTLPIISEAADDDSNAIPPTPAAPSSGSRTDVKSKEHARATSQRMANSQPPADSRVATLSTTSKTATDTSKADAEIPEPSDPSSGSMADVKSKEPTRATLKRTAKNQPSQKSTVDNLAIPSEAAADHSSAVPPATSAPSSGSTTDVKSTGPTRATRQRKPKQQPNPAETVGTFPTASEIVTGVSNSDANFPEPPAPSGSGKPSGIRRKRKPAPQKKSLIVTLPISSNNAAKVAAIFGTDAPTKAAPGASIPSSSEGQVKPKRATRRKRQPTVPQPTPAEPGPAPETSIPSGSEEQSEKPRGTKRKRQPRPSPSQGSEEQAKPKRFNKRKRQLEPTPSQPTAPPEPAPSQSKPTLAHPEHAPSHSTAPNLSQNQPEHTPVHSQSAPQESTDPLPAPSRYRRSKRLRRQPASHVAGDRGN